VLELVVVLEAVLEIVVLLLVRLLEVDALLLVMVPEFPAPGPARKYPPTPATAKTTTITTAATVVETPVLERRTAQNTPRREPILDNSRSTILNSWARITPHLNQ